MVLAEKCFKIVHVNKKTQLIVVQTHGAFLFRCPWMFHLLPNAASVMWQEEGSQSHDVPAGKHSPCPIFGLLACFIHFGLIRYSPSLFLCVFFTHSYTIYLSTHVPIKQSDREINGHFRVQDRTAVEVEEEPERCIFRDWQENTVIVPVAALRMLSNLSAASICVAEIRNIVVHRMTSSTQPVPFKDGQIHMFIL